MHCRADRRAHLATPRPREERHKAQARAPPLREAADHKVRRGQACAWAGQGGGTRPGGYRARAGGPAPSGTSAAPTGRPPSPDPLFASRPPTLPGGGAAGELIGYRERGRREQWPPPPVKGERLSGPVSRTRVPNTEPGGAATCATQFPQLPRPCYRPGSLRPPQLSVKVGPRLCLALALRQHAPRLPSEAQQEIHSGVLPGPLRRGPRPHTPALTGMPGCSLRAPCAELRPESAAAAAAAATAATHGAHPSGARRRSLLRARPAATPAQPAVLALRQPRGRAPRATL